MLLDKYVIGTNDKLPPSNIVIERVTSPFQPHNSLTYSITIPSSGPPGLTWKNDLDFGIPLIIRISKDSPFKKGCKKQFQSQIWIAAIHDEEPITIERVAEQIEYLRKINKLTFTVILTHRTTTQSTKINEHREFFESFCPIT